MTNTKIVRSMPELSSHEYWRCVHSIVNKYYSLVGIVQAPEMTTVSKIRDFAEQYSHSKIGKEQPVFLTVYKSRKPSVRYTTNDTLGVVISTAAIKEIIRDLCKSMMSSNKNNAFSSERYPSHYAFCLLDLVRYINESGVDAFEFNFTRGSFTNTYNSPPLIFSKRYSDLYIDPHTGYVRVPEHSVLFRTYGGYWRDGSEKDGHMDYALLFAEVSRDDF